MSTKNVKIFLAVLAVFLIVTPASAKDCKNPASHIETVECLHDEVTELQSQLSEATQAARLDAVQTEKMGKEVGTVAYEGLTERFDKSVAAFDAYVESQCSYEAGTYGAGTWAADASLLCKKALIEERLARLRKPLKQ